MPTNYLEKEFDKYQEKVYDYATKKFNEVIKPYMVKHNYIFLAGNGIYLVMDKKEVQIDHDDLPKYIYNILSMEIPGMDGNDLGSLMPDYDNR